jgi:hypothetical protein
MIFSGTKGKYITKMFKRDVLNEYSCISNAQQRVREVKWLKKSIYSLVQAFLLNYLIKTF